MYVHMHSLILFALSSDCIELGTVGPPITGTSMKIGDPSPDGEGEVLIRGRSTFMGYLWDEQKTRETFTEDFWCKTGDLGRY